MKVRFAVTGRAGPAEPENFVSFVTGAEARGFDALWFADIPLQASLDPVLAVATAAAVTKRIKLGVNLIPFGREPYVFARQIAQLDHLCQGRLLVTLVPGLDQPGERRALGISGVHRGRLLDHIIPVLRSLWAGGALPGDDPALPVGPALGLLPMQDPLEVWLGGSGPEAIRRAGLLADGWLGSLATPEQAGQIRLQIQRQASAAERIIDPEHFGMSVSYAHDGDELASFRASRRNPPADVRQVVPVGARSLRDFVGRLTDAGLSKFVVRPVAAVGSWEAELDWLAESLLGLQT